MLTPGLQCNGSFFFTSFWLSVGAGKLQYRGVFSVTVGPHGPNISSFLPLPNSGISQSVFTRSVRFLCWRPMKGKEEAWRGRAVWGQLWAPPSSLAIAAPLSASWPSPAPGHSSGSHSEASEAARAPDPSTGSRPALRHCPGQSPSAWGQRKWEREQASGVLNEKEENRSERNSVMEPS